MVKIEPVFEALLDRFASILGYPCVLCQLLYVADSRLFIDIVELFDEPIDFEHRLRQDPLQFRLHRVLLRRQSDESGGDLGQK